MSLGLTICQRCLGRLNLSVLSGTSRGSLKGRLRKVGLRFSEQRRTLLTAVTCSPPIQQTSSDPEQQLTVLVDAALSWASQGHTAKDPASHAIVLIHKNFIPEGSDQLLYALGGSKQLCGLNALVGVVDSVGEGAKGLSVLVASASEGVTIDTLQGEQIEELRVGRWHAKDVETEEEEPMNFENVMASIRGETRSTQSSVPPISNEREFVFAIGEMEGAQSQAETVNQMFPRADMLGITLARTPTINSLFTTLVHNGVVLPSSQVALFRVPRSPKQEYLSPHLEHNLFPITGTDPPAITSFSGNLVLELDNQPAMPSLLTLLPPQSKKELDPKPLVAKLHLSPGNLGSMYVNVLGGSRSRGGIALDPIVSSGRLKNDTKIEFYQNNRSYLAHLEPPQGAGQVHVQLETLFPHSEEGKKNIPALAMQREEFQGIKLGIFSAGSEGGFLVGQGNVVPWLCRVGGSRVQLQITGHKSGERRIPITRKSSINLDRQFVEIEAESRLDKFNTYLKNQGLLLDKRVVRDENGEINTIPVIRQDPEGVKRRFLARQKERERERQRRETLKAESEKQTEIPSYAKWQLSQKQNQRSARRHKSDNNNTTSSTLESVGKLRYDSLPPQDRWLLTAYPATEKLILENKIQSLPYHNRHVHRGARKFGFRAKERLGTSTLTRIGLRAGGYKLASALKSSRGGGSRKLHPEEVDAVTLTEELAEVRRGGRGCVSVTSIPKLDGGERAESTDIESIARTDVKGDEARDS